MNNRRFIDGLIRLIIFLSIIFVIANISIMAQGDKNEVCLSCHKILTPGIFSQWEQSRHNPAGVGCFDCHSAAEADTDGFMHNGHRIAVIVSPKDCAQCHEKEFTEQKGSHHAKAGQILGSLDNLLGEVVGGEPAVNIGCRQCHVSEVKIGADGKPTADTWPNTGMGRINPDSSWGSCSACHARHQFSVKQTRQPEACGKCHLGPDHPQIEVWNESKHGVLYHADRENMKLDSTPWRAGKEYFAGPTCSSCHMSAGGSQDVTHDVGERISWTLRPAVSVKLNMVVLDDDSKEDVIGDSPSLPKAGEMFKTSSGEIKKVREVVDWKSRRGRMQNICSQCHEKGFVAGAYAQFDDFVELYNEKFAKPAKSIIDELKAAGKLTKPDFDEQLEWTWYEIWHHEGRRGRHGAAMQGPDYAWWHGLYEVSKHFYTEFIPELKEIAGEELAKQLMDKYLFSQPGHLWYRDGMSKEALEKIQQFYQERYGK
jgi:hypothetical protein